MSPSNLPDDWYIAPAKIADYLPNPNHPDGGPNAVYFGRYGFGAAQATNSPSLSLRHAKLENFVRETVSPRGDIKFLFEGTIATPVGREARIRSVWLIDGLRAGHLVTAYPV